MDNQAQGRCNAQELRQATDQYIASNNLIIKTKRKRLIAGLICASRRQWKMTRFDAEYLGDHTFNTTVSEIYSQDGIPVARKETKRPTRFGVETNCKEYWFEPSNIEKAERVLGVSSSEV